MYLKALAVLNICTRSISGLVDSIKRLSFKNMSEQQPETLWAQLSWRKLIYLKDKTYLTIWELTDASFWPDCWIWRNEAVCKDSETCLTTECLSGTSCSTSYIFPVAAATVAAVIISVFLVESKPVEWFPESGIDWLRTGSKYVELISEFRVAGLTTGWLISPRRVFILVASCLYLSNCSGVIFCCRYAACSLLSRFCSSDEGKVYIRNVL